MRTQTAPGTDATAGNVGSFALAAAVAAAAGGVGYFYGDAIVFALAHLWSVVILPAFMTIYLSGLALCG